jgi:AraC family transcriptional activator of tynA and feaB
MDPSGSFCASVDSMISVEVAPNEPGRYRRMWQDALCEAYFPLDVRAIDGYEQPARLFAQDLPHVRVGGASCGPMSIRHLPEHISVGNCKDLFHLAIPLTASLRISQRGREAIVRRGDLAMTSTAEPYTYEQEGPSRLYTLVFEGRILREYNSRIDDLTAMTFSGALPEVQLFTSYARTLCDVAANLSLDAVENATNSLLDMLKMVLVCGQGQSVKSSSLRVAHAQIALRIIAKRFRETGFGVRELAEEFGCTPRYLQQIFQERNESLSDIIRTRRLNEAKRMLRDSTLNGLNISQVGYRVGFSNADHFSKCFSNRYGMTPRDFVLYSQFSGKEVI